jgi:hypothetical protein
LLLLAVLLAASLGAPANVVVAREQAASTSSRQAKSAYPAPPRSGYSPRHVRQLMSNCAFASAEMLIDKWTEGRRRAPQQLLRRATGIPTDEGGPTLAQLRQAVARVSGIDMRWSPNGGDPLTWHELLVRLEDGGGALVNVWPAKLPGHYRRWIPALTTGHSVYVERYDHARKRIWLMDPLGRGSDFRGEWIDADVLYRAMWHKGNLVWAAATPAPPKPRAPALSDFHLRSPEVPAVAFSDETISVGIPYAAHRLRATLPKLGLVGAWERLPEETREAEQASDESGSDSADRVEHVALTWAADSRMPDGLDPTNYRADKEPESAALLPHVPAPVTVMAKMLSATLPTPTEPGDYLLRIELTGLDGARLDGAPDFQSVAVRVRGPLAGRMQDDGTPLSGSEGELLSLAVKVRNLGSSAWGPDGLSVTLTAAFEGDSDTASEQLDVAAGEVVVVPLTLRIDTHPGRRPLRLTLVDGGGRVVPESEALEITVEIEAADTRLAEPR